MADSTPNHTLRELFQRSIQIENKAELLYRELERRFAHYPEAAALWRTLAGDEAVHAQVLRDALRAAPPEELDCVAPPEAWTSAKEILDFLDRDLCGTVENLEDAFQLAHQIEYSEAVAIFEFLAVDALPGHAERGFVRTHVLMHQRRLTDFGESYRSRNWREVLPE